MAEIFVRDPGEMGYVHKLQAVVYTLTTESIRQDSIGRCW